MAKRAFEILIIKNKYLSKPLTTITQDDFVGIYESGEIFTNNSPLIEDNLVLGKEKFENLRGLAEMCLLVHPERLIIAKSNELDLSAIEEFEILKRVKNMGRAERWSIKLVEFLFEKSRQEAENIVHMLVRKNYLEPFQTGYRKTRQYEHLISRRLKELNKIVAKETGEPIYRSDELYPGQKEARRKKKKKKTK